MNETLAYNLMDYLYENGIRHIFFVPGGGNMFLVDAAGRHPKIKTIATHHEQSAVIAAEAYSRMTNNIGVALVTTGPDWNKCSYWNCWCMVRLNTSSGYFGASQNG